jgi:hypothetical protein
VVGGAASGWGGQESSEEGGLGPLGCVTRNDGENVGVGVDLLAVARIVSSCCALQDRKRRPLAVLDGCMQRRAHLTLFIMSSSVACLLAGCHGAGSVHGEVLWDSAVRACHGDSAML